MTKSLYAVYGASGCGRGIMPLAHQQLMEQGSNSSQLVFVDDNPASDKVNGHVALSYAQFLSHPETKRFAAIAIANSQVRERLAQRMINDGVTPWSITSNNTVIMDDVTIGEGALLSPFVTLTSNIRIGRFFQANLYSYVEHDCVIGDFVTFAPRVSCNGNIVIEDYAYIGTGAVIRQGKPGKPLVIGKGAVVGMGAVVTKDVAAGTTVIGNPARLFSKH